MITRPVLSYAIDEDDSIVQVDDGYYRFAEENGWDGAGASLGRSLWHFVAGEELQRMQRMLLRRIRGEDREVELPFRCDGPGVQREMGLRIGARSAGRFVVFTASLWDERTRPAWQPLLAADSPRGASTLTMCGWCDRFLIGDEWLEVEDAAQRLGLFRRDELPEISHDVCPDCGKLLLAA